MNQTTKTRKHRQAIASNRGGNAKQRHQYRRAHELPAPARVIDTVNSGHSTTVKTNAFAAALEAEQRPVIDEVAIPQGPEMTAEEVADEAANELERGFGKFPTSVQASPTHLEQVAARAVLQRHAEAEQYRQDALAKARATAQAAKKPGLVDKFLGFFRRKK
jgi:hypothetical protein